MSDAQKTHRSYNLDDDVVSALHDRADRNSRSDSAELNVILRKTLKLKSPKRKE